MRRLYRVCREASLRSGTPFPQQALETLEISARWSEHDEARIPASGPLVVVANHPFGAAEGLAVLKLLAARRPDTKVLANYLLARIPELRPHLISVDPFESHPAAQRNAQALRAALQWVRAGHALVVFPAGEVASLAPGRWFRVAEAPWHPSVVTLVRNAGDEVRVLPVFVPGRASRRFLLAGKIHPRLRTALLPRELLRLRRRTLTLRVGSAFPAKTRLAALSDAEALRYLRFRTLLLAGREGPSPFEEQMRRLTYDTDERAVNPVIPPQPAETIEAELYALPPEARLLEEGDYTVYAVQGRAIPATLREIGRLREIAFRAAGEGTGQDQDTDDFDAAYYQIVLWHRALRTIIGCYRLALSDRLVEHRGLQALYTRTLFRFDERFLGHLPGPALELGRSFVRPDFQRTFAPLLLLWRGVLAFVAAHPRYTVLFGPVSLSHDFRDASRDLILRHLRAKAFDAGLARWIAPRLAPKPMRLPEWGAPEYAGFLDSEADINTALGELEEGEREMPVLIRQYLKLGGRIAAFNVDPDFGTVVDGLIVVDLLKAPPRDIARYMGKEAYERYLNTPRKDF